MSASTGGNIIMTVEHALKRLMAWRSKSSEDRVVEISIGDDDSFSITLYESDDDDALTHPNVWVGRTTVSEGASLVECVDLLLPPDDLDDFVAEQDEDFHEALRVRGEAMSEHPEPEAHVHNGGRNYHYYCPECIRHGAFVDSDGLLRRIWTRIRVVVGR